MKFICPDHGEVKPTKIGYSAPITGWCPFCQKQLDDEDFEGFNILSEEEAILKRPDFPRRNKDGQAEGDDI